MVNTWWYEKTEVTKLLIALWTEDLDLSLVFSEAILGSLLASSIVIVIVAAKRYGAIL